MRSSYATIDNLINLLYNLLKGQRVETWKFNNFTSALTPISVVTTTAAIATAKLGDFCWG